MLVITQSTVCFYSGGFWDGTYRDLEYRFIYTVFGYNNLKLVHLPIYSPINV